jgi:hypothetical protein
MPSSRFRFAVLLTLLLAACGGESQFPSGPAASISISLSANAVSLTPGGTATVTVTLTRSNGFDEIVSVNVVGLPNGVTAATLTLPAGQPSGTLTLVATASAVPGTTALVVRATAPVVNPATATLSLVIQPPPAGFSLSASPNTLTLQQGTTGNATITIARSGGFSGSVALTVTGLPTGVTASFNPASVASTGTTSTLTLTASATATVGAAPLTITGTATGASNQTASFALTVQSNPGAGNTVSVAFCPATGNPMWVAFQDGTGPWTRATANNGVYSTQVSSGRGGIAYVTTTATGGIQTTVRYGTTDELQAFNEVFCLGATGAGKTVEYSLIGAGTDNVTLGLGSATASASGGNPGQPFQNVPDGVIDLIAARSTTTPNGQVINKLFALRDQNPASGARLPVNFTGQLAVDPVTAPLTIVGLNGQQALVNYSYRTPNRTLVLYGSDAVGLSASRTIVGFPPVAGSFHQARVIAAPVIGPSVDRIRSVDVVFAAVAPRTLTLGPEMGTVTVSTAGVSPLRPQAVIPAAAPYHQSWNFTMSQGTGAQARSATVQSTIGYVGGSPTTVTLVAPELTGVAGYLFDWGLRDAVSTNWTAVGQSATGFGAQGAWTEGASTLFAGRSGILATQQ